MQKIQLTPAQIAAMYATAKTLNDDEYQWEAIELKQRIKEAIAKRASDEKSGLPNTTNQGSN